MRILGIMLKSYSKISCLIIFYVLFTTQFVLSQTRAERKQLKKEQKQAAYQKVKNLIESGNFQFVANWASPLDQDVINIGSQFIGGGNIFQGGRVNLTGNNNHLRIIESEKADIYMPFFGRQFFATNQSVNNNSIIFKGDLETYIVRYKDKRRQIIIKFSAKSQSDTLDGILIINSNLSSTLNLSSTNKQSISYNGTISEIEESQEK